MQLTRDQTGRIEVDGETYVWELRRQPRPVGGNVWEGMAVSLRHADYRREAIVQFPAPLRPNGRPDVEKQRVNVDAVKTAVASIIAAGWDPATRGKPMVFDVDADGN
ncbi:hypothetical protein [Brevundimonas sp.]|jgi:hypothetical protein|uniref:hypothetical protein n=1 Tax=Brevundimonas sp. TaxID=1871086 RepID=UPI000D474EF5|nr:hypothetical protein [Brevundimonas sp.]PST25365.1 hypothetical protein C7U60_06905 [Mesorhizobium plurifarium]PZU01408.1 MAG: hypothetical protein DI624_00015 [Brevundimonas sp.]